MDQLADLISRQLAGAFERAGYGDADARATLSNRPDLCEYQCNGALPAAKLYLSAHPDRAGGGCGAVRLRTV